MVEIESFHVRLSLLFSCLLGQTRKWAEHPLRHSGSQCEAVYLSRARRHTKTAPVSAKGLAPASKGAVGELPLRDSCSRDGFTTGCGDPVWQRTRRISTSAAAQQTSRLENYFKRSRSDQTDRCAGVDLNHRFRFWAKSGGSAVPKQLRSQLHTFS